MALINKLQQFFFKHKLIADLELNNLSQERAKKNLMLVLSLSGGVDSIVMAYALRQLANKFLFSLKAVHINHNISPHSQQWQDFCQDFAKDKNIEFFSFGFNIDSKKDNTYETQARKLRYEKCIYLCHKLQLEYPSYKIALVTAHHLDDNLETFIMNLSRGSGITGLTSIKPVSEKNGVLILRPLLEIRKKEIIEFAKNYNLQWVTDESNNDIRIKRNAIRHNLIPILVSELNTLFFNKQNSDFLNSFNKSQNNLLEDLRVQHILLDEKLDKIANQHKIKISELLKYDISLQRYLIQRWLVRYLNLQVSYNKVAMILNVCKTGKGEILLKQFLPSLQVYKNYLYLKMYWSYCDYGSNSNTSKIYIGFKRLQNSIQFNFSKEADKITIAAYHKLKKNFKTNHVKKLFQMLAVPPWLRQDWPCAIVDKKAIFLVTNMQKSILLKQSKFGNYLHPDFSLESIKYLIEI